MDARADKDRLRAELKARRTALTPRELQVAGDAAARLVTQLPEWKQAKTVCLYASFGGELPTDALMLLALLEGKRLLLPRVTNKTSARPPRGHRPRRPPAFASWNPRTEAHRASRDAGRSRAGPRARSGLRRRWPTSRVRRWLLRPPPRQAAPQDLPARPRPRLPTGVAPPGRAA